MADEILIVSDLIHQFPVKDGVLGKRVGMVKAVDGVSFEIKKGETFGLIGESGCGKTTIGRAILNLIKPTEGSVTFNGQLLYDIKRGKKIGKDKMRSLRRHMQIIFQDPYGSLDPRMNIGAIVSEGLLKHDMASGKEALKLTGDILKMCGLSDTIMNRYPHEFSGGQRQRIALARAFILKPDFIVCDEPTAALDVSTQAQILNLLLQFKEKFQLSLLFISHDLSIVRNFCDRSAVMYLGNIVEVANTSMLFRRPQHPYTKALLSAIPISYPGEKRDRIILRGEIPSPANLPDGCNFHTRCPFAKDICKKVKPEHREVEPGHFVSCHLIVGNQT